jgi:hypothetical protein
MKQFLRQCVAYVRNNPEGYWFKRKLYGWGWTPVRWQGWLVTLAAIGAIVWLAVRFERGGYADDAVVTQLLLPVFGIVAVLVAICYRTGESPRWQWGFPPSHTETEILTRK